MLRHAHKLATGNDLIPCKESTNLISWQSWAKIHALHQTYRPSITSCFVIELFLLSLHVFEKWVFAQILVIGRPLNVNILRHLELQRWPRTRWQRQPLTALCSVVRRNGAFYLSMRVLLDVMWACTFINTLASLCTCLSRIWFVSCSFLYVLFSRGVMDI